MANDAPPSERSIRIIYDRIFEQSGWANVSAMPDTDLMLHNRAAKSSRMERVSGIANEIFRRYVPIEKEVKHL